jgi:hypothetical protein
MINKILRKLLLFVNGDNTKFQYAWILHIPYIFKKYDYYFLSIYVLYVIHIPYIHLVYLKKYISLIS